MFGAPACLRLWTTDVFLASEPHFGAVQQFEDAAIVIGRRPPEEAIPPAARQRVLAVQRTDRRAHDGGDRIVVLRVVDRPDDRFFRILAVPGQDEQDAGTVSSRKAPEYQSRPAFRTDRPSFSAEGTCSWTKRQMGPR